MELLDYINAEELNQIEQLFHTGNHMETNTSIDDKEREEGFTSFYVRLFKVNWKAQRLLKTHSR